MAGGLRIWRPELYEEVPCSNCGKIFERRHMKEYRPGRTTLLYCPECQHKATMAIYAARSDRVERMNKIKKR